MAAAARRLRKKCERCGAVAMVRPRERRCRARRPGTAYMCWGPLVLAPMQRLKAERRPQEIAAAEAEKAQGKIGEHLASVKRLMTAIDKWQKRASYYGKRAAMSDQDLAAEKAQREERERLKKSGKKTRAIAIEE